MADDFDPYYQWLGIPPKHQPPDHYRLLGIEQFEGNSDVIGDAAERQIAHVRRKALSQHSQISQRILNELAAAKSCLLDPTKKARYDESLTTQRFDLTTALHTKGAAAQPAVQNALRRADRYLLGFVGIENALLHQFLRIALPLVVVAVIIFAVVFIAPSIRSGSSNSQLNAKHEAMNTQVHLEIVPTVDPEDRPLMIPDSSPSPATTVAKSPVFEPLIDKTVAVGQTLIFSLVTEVTTDQRRFHMSGLPDNATLDPITGVFTWKPEFDQAGRVYRVEFTVTDNNLTARDIQQSISISVTAMSPGDIVVNSIGMKLAYIPAGEFLMGTSDAELRAVVQSDPKLQNKLLTGERPTNLVRITRPFFMSVYETTQSDFQRLLERNPSSFSSTGSHSQAVSDLNTSQFPVENVTWFDSIEFCNKLSEADGRSPYYQLTMIERRKDQSLNSATVTVSGGNGYRLPTEAEWEYACRAHEKRAFHFGNVLNGDNANVDGTHPFGTSAKGSFVRRTTTVGAYNSNAFGLFDMHGNVWEWCFDDFDGEVYGSRSGTTNDPVVTSRSKFRVLRGGSWNWFSRYSRSACRLNRTPDDSNFNFGFRVACDSP